MLLSRRLRSTIRYSSALNGIIESTNLALRSAMSSSVYDGKGSRDSVTPKISGTGIWVDAKNGEVPKRAVIGGIDKNHETTYVARAMDDGDMIPGKLVPSHGCVFIAADHYEIPEKKYQVLVEGYWMKAKGSDIPVNAFPSGYTDKGELLYVGRILVKNKGLTPGQVIKSAGGCYAYIGLIEFFEKEYEIYCT